MGMSQQYKHPRDHVFGLIGIATRMNNDVFPVDYNIGTAALFTQVIKMELLLAARGAEILIVAHNRMEPRPSSDDEDVDEL